MKRRRKEGGGKRGGMGREKIMKGKEREREREREKEVGEGEDSDVTDFFWVALKLLTRPLNNITKVCRRTVCGCQKTAIPQLNIHTE